MIQAHTNESLLQKCSRLLLCLEVKRFFETFHFLCAFCVHEKGCKFVCMKKGAKRSLYRSDSRRTFTIKLLGFARILCELDA